VVRVRVLTWTAASKGSSQWYVATPGAVRIRWRVGRRSFSRAFPHRARAEEYASRLRVAAADGDRFEVTSGEPTGWSRTDVRFADWAAE